VRLKRTTAVGDHHITVPDHRIVAKGTLNDTLSTVSVQSGISKQTLLKELRG
jgi:hypothetical protein